MEILPNSWEERELAHCFHTFTDLPALAEHGPTILARGEGIFVFDVHGRRYLEGNSGLWNITLGYNNSELIEAALAQMRRLPAYHTFFGRNSEPTVALAEQLVNLAPVPMRSVFFTNSGSEANDSVAKLLWMINKAEGMPHRRKLISRVNAYHGTTVMTSSLTGKAYVGAFGLPLPEVIFADCPHYWRYGEPGETEEDYSARLARRLEAVVEREGPETIAGFFAEPVMGAGGVIVPPKGYFEAIQGVLRQFDIPLVADEVICGFGRTGALWGSQMFNLVPDIIVASKVLTAGYFPIGAVMLSPNMDQRLTQACNRFEEFPHGYTTGGHPIGSAVALKVIEILIRGGVLNNVVSLGSVFQRGIRALSNHPMVGEARGVGLMGALEIVSDKIGKKPFEPQIRIGERIVRAALDRGLIVRPIGASVVIAPPFIATPEQIQDILAIVKEVLDTVHTALIA